MKTRWLLAAILPLSLLMGNLEAAGVRSPRSMPSAAISARPLLLGPTNTQTVLVAAEWTTMISPLPPIQNIVAIAAGHGHTCALTTAGGVKCWGANGNGQLGDGTTTHRSTPVDVVGLGSGVAAIAAGAEHTCALNTAGGVKCWGRNEYGQLGDGTTTHRSTPVDVAGLASDVAAIAAGYYHTCAVTTAGGVKCWGANWYSQLGDGTTMQRNTPVDVTGLASGTASIAAGYGHTCAGTTAGGIKCWGRNLWGQLGDGTTTQRSTPVDVAGLGSGVTTIAAGDRHTCAVTTAAEIKCWGNNGHGQLGDGTMTNRSTPVDVAGLASGAAAIAAGAYHTCTLITTGGVKCWGRNASGQLGDGTTTQRSTPVDVVGLGSGEAALAAGYGHTCALLTAGGVKCWGDNWYGQLGDGMSIQRSTPMDVTGLGGGVAAIAAGSDHTCALLSTGGVKCWGQNQYSQLGDGTRIDRSTPVDVAGLASGVAAIAAGDRHTCAVTTAGGAKCWGANEYGQLGDGTTTSRSTPVDVAGLASGVAAISTGGDHTCALLTAGGVKCWGYNWYGQLGDGTTVQRSTPVDVAGLGSGVATIAAGDSHTCAVTTAGGAKCWGANWAGQLGNGTWTTSSTPVDVAGLANEAAAIAAGAYHTCALTTSGGVRCWGWNEYGQLGDGTRIERGTPVDVAGLASGMAAIAAGGGHTCALLTAGGVRCWGDNGWGQLGDGTTTHRITPVDVVGLGSGVAAIAAGAEHTCALTTTGGVKCWGADHSGQLGLGTIVYSATPIDVVMLLKLYLPGILRGW